MNKYSKLGPISRTVSSAGASASIPETYESEYDNEFDDGVTSQLSDFGSSVNDNWLESDLAELKDSDLKVQLGAIFGDRHADDFLNPKMKDKPRVSIDKKVIRKVDALDAHELWHGLRNQSEKKLERNMMREQHLQKPVLSAGDRISRSQEQLSKINYGKHQLALMHQIASVNKVKMKQLLHAVQLPKMNESGELTSDPNPMNFCNNSLLTNLKQCKGTSHNLLDENSNKIPDEKIALEETPSLDDKSIYDSNFILDNKNVIFVTEKGCTYQGKFKERLQELGIESNLGIAKTIRARPNAEIKPLDFPGTASMVEKRALGALTQNIKGEKRVTSRQPLSIAALSDYCRSIPVPGEGEYSNGKIQLWKGMESS